MDMTKNQAVSRRELRKAIIAAAIGNFITWFEYAAFGFLAVIIGKVFFPEFSVTAGLLATFAAFGISFLMAPLGALYFGRLGDTAGRKNILAVVILIMSGSTFAIGLLPGFESWGVFSPLALVLLRMLQGFASGGEPGGAATFLVESAPHGKKAFTVSFWHCSSFMANACAALLILTLTHFVSDRTMQDWGWRIPFLISGPLGIVAWYIRSQLEETPAFRALERSGDVAKAPVSEALHSHWKEILQTTGCIALQGAAFYFIFVYVQTYLQVELGLTFLQASASNILCLTSAALCIFLFAKISDRIGRKPVLLTGAVLCALCIYPTFLVFSTKIIWAIYLSHALMGICLAIFMSASGAALVEIFPARVRYAGFSIGFNLSVALFGGSAAWVATWLIQLTGSPLSPAFIIIVTGLMASLATITMKESVQKNMHQFRLSKKLISSKGD